MNRDGAGIRGPLLLYGGIVCVYLLLMAWWVYFFGVEHERVAEVLAAADTPLTAEQQATVAESSARTQRMFLFEGGFVGLLLLGSSWLVLRAVRREIGLHREQRNFLLAVTHELRSPIASAGLYIQSLQMGRVTAEKSERYLQHAREDLDRLGTMVENILTTRRMSEGGVDVRPEPIDLHRVVGRLLPRLAEIARHAGAHVDLLPAPEEPGARADVASLEAILDNLLSNAVKYGGEEPRIEVGVRSQGRQTQLYVRDHGPGLEGADPDALVQPFVRGGDERVRTRPGVGLGLSIVRRLAEAQGATLALAEVSDGGVEARVSFPAASADEVERAAFPEARERVA